MRISLVEQVDTDNLSLINLIKNGLKAAPEVSVKLNDKLKIYIDKYMDDNFHENVFPDSANTESCNEGGKITVQVNKYERSSVARQKCININGCYCHVCTLNFEKIYGDMGAGFIHVHHIIPLHQIDEQYIVDPINDLIPVCPNCHAMLHRQINGQYLSVEQLKLIIKTTKL